MATIRCGYSPWLRLTPPNLQRLVFFCLLGAVVFFPGLSTPYHASACVASEDRRLAASQENHIMKPQSRVVDEVEALDALVLAFVVQVQGSWTPQALATWRAQLARQGWTLSQD